MSTDQQATLDAWEAEHAEATQEPAESNDDAQRPDSTRDDADSLASVFQTVTGETTIVDAQEEAPSHDPITDDSHETHVVQDGLDDATEGGEGWI